MVYGAIAIRQFGRFSFGSLDGFHSAVWMIKYRRDCFSACRGLEMFSWRYGFNWEI
jgi:hypothetical protein